jgi:hypothetical protein
MQPATTERFMHSLYRQKMLAGLVMFLIPTSKLERQRIWAAEACWKQVILSSLQN